MVRRKEKQANVFTKINPSLYALHLRLLPYFYPKGIILRCNNRKGAIDLVYKFYEVAHQPDSENKAIKSKLSFVEIPILELNNGLRFVVYFKNRLRKPD